MLLINMLCRFTNTFLHFLGLMQSGVVDAATLGLIKMPRCGIKDDMLQEHLSVDNITEVHKASTEIYSIITFSKTLLKKLG